MKSVFYYICFFFCSCVVPQYLTADATIQGTITDSVTSLPISGALVEAIRGGQVRYSDTSAPDGTYSLTGVQPSNYTLEVNAPGYQIQSVGVNPTNNEITTVDFQLVPHGGEIDGTVTDATTTLPISGATIRILQGIDLILSTTTNGTGFYSAPNLSPGNYTVEASATGYQTQFQGAIVQVNTIKTVNFALATQPGTISGTVIDAATTNPIQGALVEIFDGFTLIGFSDTDINGNYTIPDLAPGTYIVVATAMDYQDHVTGATVVSNVTTTVDFALQSNPGTISGTVTNVATAAPIASATISVFSGSVFIESTLTDPNGNYTLPGLAPGNYTLVAHAANFQSAEVGATVTSNSTTVVNFALLQNPGTISGTVIDAVTTNPIAGASIEVFLGQTLVATDLTDPSGNYQIEGLAPGNYIVNCVKASYQMQTDGAIVTSNETTIVDFALIANPGAISGTITDVLTTNPIEGATILVFRGRTFMGLAITDINGHYTVVNLAPGQYIVHANAPGYQSKVTGVTVVSNVTSTVDFALQPNPGIISGTVTNAVTAAPIASATISVFSGSAFIESTLTDSNGNYLLPGLAPGHYTLVTQAANFQSDAVGATVASNSTTTVNFLLSPESGSISGKVTNSVTTNPIPNATVEVLNGPILIASALTDPSGNYSIPNLEQNTYTVMAKASGFSQKSQSITVNANQTTTANFALDPTPGTIAGTVTDALTTNPIPSATVRIFQGTTFIAFDLTDVNGSYSIPDLAPGNYFVVASADGYQTKVSAKTVITGLTTIANFALDSSPGAIEGRVVESCGGTPIHGALITVTDGSTIVGFDLSDVNGNYFISGLAPGNYTVTAAKKNFLIGNSPATVTANATTIVNFSLQPTVLPPINISGRAIKNEFLTQTDLIHVISWTASPSSCVTGYQVFRNGKQIAFVSSSSKLEYQDHNRNKKTDVYAVKTVNAFGMVSDAISVTINDKTKCQKKRSTT